MASTKKNIAQTVAELITPTVESLGYSIWDVEYIKEGAEWYLRITIDSPNGVDLNDVEKVHRAIDPVIDSADPIQDFYYLDVSSPGLERNIRTPGHYRACVGCEIEVRLFSALNGVKQLSGVLEGISDDDEEIELSSSNKTIKIKRNMISKANIKFNFDELDVQDDDGGENE